MDKKSLFGKGHIPWNKGLNKNNNSIIAESAKRHREWSLKNSPFKRRDVQIKIQNNVNVIETHFKKGQVVWNKGVRINRILYPTMGHFKKHTEETKAKIGIKSVGRKSGMGGKVFTSEHREKIRINRLKQKFPRVSSIEIKIRNLLDVLEVKYIPQYIIYNEGFLTFVDIYLPGKNLCVYCDGDYWHNRKGSKERDGLVNKKLGELGYKVLRLWESEIISEEKQCVDKIINYK